MPSCSRTPGGAQAAVGVQEIAQRGEGEGDVVDAGARRRVREPGHVDDGDAMVLVVVGEEA
jgi:hypothetical protein